ncbi:vacuolar protein sorting-associated protein 13A-like [Gossypium australe]|uniref:Vacuolar protein sorting-associated protein 13A-like n=1 Tax=Gossypium australe TaxID=47621 RepID=A0A5B6V6J1_9ROSI|nr:vacuolar protein sorting-associated protein 13A-like [Gossypium australe]
MLERVVHQVLLGYLGRYVKDFSRDQVKVTLWNIEVELKDIDLILEAFDYLQLPFALKQGRVGRLSIKVPWSLIGGEPILIALENVFFSVSPRDDHEVFFSFSFSILLHSFEFKKKKKKEKKKNSNIIDSLWQWRMDAIETRELAGKKAKLAAAELAKLSRRVCADNKGGWSFIPFVTTKVLENIQVSIRNFHVLYSDMQSNSVSIPSSPALCFFYGMQVDLEQVLFGLRFSSLTMLKQNSVGLRMGQVSKVVEVEGLEIYCSICKDAAKDLSLSNTGGSESWFNSHCVGDKSEHIVEPFNVSLSLLVLVGFSLIFACDNKTLLFYCLVMVNRSEKLNDLPQYSISAKMTCLVVSLNEIQLQQILILSDYLSTSQLREKFLTSSAFSDRKRTADGEYRYGRYHPWSSPLSRKEDGWQRLWWHYAQESILSDVREKLKKTSWRYLGQRLSNRRKYVNLYKTKLELLRQDQPIDESLIRDLEQMEKESDIDDILSYRSAAEHELQEVLLKSSTANFSVEKSRLDGQSSGKSRGWLNWLSRGMLGAGGTDDSSQFSGVVSDEDVQDIYEATKFYPPVLSGIDADTNDKIYSRAIEFSIDEISATIWSITKGTNMVVTVPLSVAKNNSENDKDRALVEMNLCQDIARLNLHGAIMKCNLQEELVNVIAFVKSGEMVNAGNEQVIRLMSCIEKNVGEDLPSYRVQVDLYQRRDVELSVNVMLQSLEVAYETTFFWDLIEFFSVIKYFEFQHERLYYFGMLP